jgi:hypothetical protein
LWLARIVADVVIGQPVSRRPAWLRDRDRKSHRRRRSGGEGSTPGLRGAGPDGCDNKASWRIFDCCRKALSFAALATLGANPCTVRACLIALSR